MDMSGSKLSRAFRRGLGSKRSSPLTGGAAVAATAGSLASFSSSAAEKCPNELIPPAVHVDEFMSPATRPELNPKGDDDGDDGRARR